MRDGCDLIAEVVVVLRFLQGAMFSQVALRLVSGS